MVTQLQPMRSPHEITNTIHGLRLVVPESGYIVANLSSGIQHLVPNVHHTSFRHSKSSTYQPCPRPRPRLSEVTLSQCAMECCLHVTHVAWTSAHGQVKSVRIP